MPSGTSRTHDHDELDFVKGGLWWVAFLFVVRSARMSAGYFHTMITYLQAHWFDLVQSLFIIAGFLLAVLKLSSDYRSRRIESLIELVKGHRDIWRLVIENPALSRILQEDVDLKIKPITQEEKWFVLLSIMHLYSAFESSKEWMSVSISGIGKDIKGYFAYPIPNAVWRDVKELQNKDFVAFVEKHLQETPHNSMSGKS